MPAVLGKDMTCREKTSKSKKYGSSLLYFKIKITAFECGSAVLYMKILGGSLPGVQRIGSQCLAHSVVAHDGASAPRKHDEAWNALNLKVSRCVVAARTAVWDGAPVPMVFG